MTNGEGLIALGVALAIGLGGGWLMTRPTLVTETPAPEIIQADGSRVLVRAPDPKAKPKHQIPKGAKVERIISLVAQGQGIKLPNGEVRTCPRVTVDLSLVRDENGMKRVVASSPDGAIVGAFDIPVETIAQPDAHPWAVGVSINPVNQTAGLWAERDIGRVRMGVDLNQARASVIAPMAAEIRVRVGWAF